MSTTNSSVLIFDLNETLLDLSELRESVAEALNGDKKDVSLWFEMMLHYSLVANASDEYHNFGDIGAAVLKMLAEQRGIAINATSAKEVLQPIRTTPPHPEVPEALEKLKTHGYRLAILTNSPRKGMEQQLYNAGISTHFERQLSVEDIGLFKPERHVYRWAARQMQTVPEESLLLLLMLGMLRELCRQVLKQPF